MFLLQVHIARGVISTLNHNMNHMPSYLLHAEPMFIQNLEFIIISKMFVIKFKGYIT